LADGRRIEVSNFTGPTLNDGSAALTFDLPENAAPDDTNTFELTVTDSVTGSVFKNRAEMVVRPEAELPPRPAVERRQPGKTADVGTDGPGGIELPRIFWLPQPDDRWSEHFSGPDDCLDVIDDGEPDETGRVQHDYSFYLNEHNRALRFELSTNKLAAAAVKKQFEIAVTLVGLALLQEADKHEEGADGDTAENAAGPDLDVSRDRVARATRALAPILLPLINTLSDLGQFEADESDLVGVAA
jgi:hypothetical protein